MRLRKEGTNEWDTSYTVLTDAGLVLGTVHRERTSKARHVKGTGGVTRWVATSPDGEVVSKTNTYRRADAVEALEAHAARPSWVCEPCKRGEHPPYRHTGHGDQWCVCRCMNERPGTVPTGR